MFNLLNPIIAILFTQKHNSIVPFRFIILFIACFHYSATFSQKNEEIKLLHHYESALKEFDTYEQNHRRFTQTKHVNLSYLDWGNNQNKDQVLIWLHGSLSNAYEFSPFATELIKTGYRIISIDQYNAGKTALPPFDASFDDLCIDIKSLMDTLGIQHAVIGGFSRGGYLATNFYKLFPNYVSALILEDGGSVAFNTSYFKLNELELNQKLQQVNLPDEIKEKYCGYHNNRFDAYKSLYDEDNKTNQFEIFSFIKPQDQKWVTYRGQSEYYHMRDSLQMAETIFGHAVVSKYASSIVKIFPLKIFERLNVPILIMDASSVNDPMPVYTENKILANKHPDLIQHIVIENVDHNIHFTYPDKFLKMIIKFLKKV